MRIFLIRHGETTGDVEGRYGGDYNDHLSSKGKAECEELSNKLKGKGIEVVFHSPKVRAMETARIINSVLRVKLEKVDDIRERNNYGVITGLTKAEAQARHPKEIEKLAGGSYLHNVRGSEGYGHFKRRVVKALENITKRKVGTVAIVSHGGPIRCILREVIKAGELEKLGDCAFFEIEKQTDRYRLISMENASIKR